MEFFGSSGRHAPRPLTIWPGRKAIVELTKSACSRTELGDVMSGKGGFRKFAGPIKRRAKVDEAACE